MYKYVKPFGVHVLGNSIGEGWLDLVRVILEMGEKTYDEKRARLSLQNVRFRIQRYELPDKLIEKYGDKKRIEKMISLTFKDEEMCDVDVIPSFSPGAKSYFLRIKEGKLFDFVIKRLSLIPESKKAVISFIHWDDYKAVLSNQYDDYLPCIVSIQFRLLEKIDCYEMTTIFNARSMDAFQKGSGNMITIAMLSDKVRCELDRFLCKPIKCGAIDGLITDAHVYDESLPKAKRMVKDYLYRRDWGFK